MEQVTRAEPFVSNDDALLVLHRAVEDEDFQRFLDGLPIVHLVGQFLDWVGECEDLDDPEGEFDPSYDPTEVVSEDTADHTADVIAGEALDDEAHLLSEAALAQRLGVELIGCTAVERWRPRVLSLACARWGLVSLTEEGLERSPDVMGWSASEPQDRAWARALVVAAAIECTVRYVSAQHLAGDDVQRTFATMLASAADEHPWPLGLLSAMRPDDVVAEHVDRVVLEHVTELRTWGVLAEGDHLRVAPGAEPLLRSIAVNLRADLAPSAPAAAPPPAPAG